MDLKGKLRNGMRILMATANTVASTASMTSTSHSGERRIPVSAFERHGRRPPVRGAAGQPGYFETDERMTTGTAAEGEFASRSSRSG